MGQFQLTPRSGLALLVLCALAACTGPPSPDAALDSLRDKSFSPKYHSGFWADEAKKGSPLWAKAQEFCRLPENAQNTNCRIVLAVDLTVRIVPVSPPDDTEGREHTWIRKGAEHLKTLESAPRTGFRDLPPIPTPPQR